jgi:hypothetical protein
MHVLVVRVKSMIAVQCHMHWQTKLTASFVDRYRWEEDRKVIAHDEREPSPFLVLYDVKTGSGCRRSAKGDSSE